MAFVTFPDHYVFTIESGPVAGTTRWRNSISIVTAASAGLTETEGPIIAFENLIQGFQRHDSQLYTGTLRNWTRGDVPFSQQGFVWQKIYSGKTGTVATTLGYTAGEAGDDPDLGEICARLVLPPHFAPGKSGSLFLRNCYRDLDIVASPGGPPVNSGYQGNKFGAGAITTAAEGFMSAYFQNNPLPRFCLVKYSVKEGGPPHETPVHNIVCTGPTMNNLTRKGKK
jgi:hypothetical protein